VAEVWREALAAAPARADGTPRVTAALIGEAAEALRERRVARSHAETHAERLAAVAAAVAGRGASPAVTALPYDRVVRGVDAGEYLRALPDGCADVAITSPPYWMKRTYLPGDARELGQEPDPADYVDRLCAVLDEVGRVLAPAGTLWLNLGDTLGSQPGGYRGDPSRRRGLSARGVTVNGTAPAGRELDVPAKSFCLIPETVALRLVLDSGWRLLAKIAWCLSDGARVYARTPEGDGPVAVNDLVRRDPRSVQLWNGERWTQVLAWTLSRPTLEGEARRRASDDRRHARSRGRAAPAMGDLEIEFRSGERVSCTPEHQWPTKRGNVHATDLRVGDIVPQVRLPEPEDTRAPALFDDEELGWVLGFYLAEGYPGNRRIRFAIHAKERAYFERIARIARDAGTTATWRHVHDNGAEIAVYGRLLPALVNTYIAGHGAKGKHLAMSCWRRSDAFLRALLQGYLDGDGHHDVKSGRWVLVFSRNDALAADLRTLAARLGYSVRLRCRVAKFNGKEYPVHRGELRLTQDPRTNAKQNEEVVAIRASRARRFWDISVADEPHVFALASGLLTHNSKLGHQPENVHDRFTQAWEPVYVLTRARHAYLDRGAWDERPTDVWAIPVGRRGAAGGHPAPFPEELVRRALRHACPPGGVVLDPFAGSGTVLAVARAEGRRFLGCDLAPDDAAAEAADGAAGAGLPSVAAPGDTTGAGTRGCG
jgi:DNA modification methylase